MKTHFAHRPRQSCRKRSGRAAVRPLQMEQLALFELEPMARPPGPGSEAVPAFVRVTRPTDTNGELAHGAGPADRAFIRHTRLLQKNAEGRAPVECPRPIRRRRRRKAWLPRLIRWVRARAPRRK